MRWQALRILYNPIRVQGIGRSHGPMRPTFPRFDLEDSPLRGDAEARDSNSAHWVVSGRVQGVGFRWFVQQAARRRRMLGDVRNLADGRVEIRVSGAADQIAELLSEVRQGPPGARVEGVENLVPDPGLTLGDFEVRF